MKKIALLLGIVAFLAACQKTRLIPEKAEEPSVELNIDLEINDGTPETRGIKKSWAKGDKVYIFFDKEICNPPQYLVVKYNAGWEVESWSSGLKEKIAKRKSGTLTALYMPNDKVYGTIDVKYKNSTTYGIAPKDKNGDGFYSYWLEAKGVNYTVTNNVLSATVSLKSGYNSVTQFCLPNKDRQGNTIDNSTASGSSVYKYRLSYEGTGSSYGCPYAVYQYSNNDTFTKGGNLYNEMNAYFYAGLCFSCLPIGAGGQRTFKFTLTDRTNTYVYSTTCEIKGNKAYKLPALNEKDSSGKYKWVLQ